MNGHLALQLISRNVATVFMHIQIGSAGLPAQLLYEGIPLVIARFITFWGAARLRFLGVTATLDLHPGLDTGKVYYVDGILPVILAAGAVSAEGGSRRRAGRAPGGWPSASSRWPAP